MNVMFAAVDASVSFGGAQRAIHKGTHWPASDPLVIAYPHLFSPDPRYGMAYTVEPEGYDAPPVESASAAPGERRSTRRSSAA
jgi:hypothetical protein